MRMGSAGVPVRDKRETSRIARLPAVRGCWSHGTRGGHGGTDHRDARPAWPKARPGSPRASRALPRALDADRAAAAAAQGGRVRGAAAMRSSASRSVVASANAIWARLEAAGLTEPAAMAAARMTSAAGGRACRGRRCAMAGRWRRRGWISTRCGAAPNRRGDRDAGRAAGDRGLDGRDLCDVLAGAGGCVCARRSGLAGGRADAVRAGGAAVGKGAAGDGRGLVALAGVAARLLWAYYRVAKGREGITDLAGNK